MKCIATIPVDLKETPLGTASRFAQEIAGQSVLARTITQVAAARRLDGVFVICPADQEAQCGQLLTGLPAELRIHSAGRPPYGPLVRAARKWSLDSWRGGIGGAGVVDEYVHTAVLGALGAQERADVVVAIPGPCPLIDPALIDILIEHYRGVSDESRLAFMQTPPGLAPTVFQTALLAEMATQPVPPGFSMSYRPDQPEVDLAFRKCARTPPQALRHASGRLIADTARAVETIREYLEGNPYGGAEHVGNWLIERRPRHLPPLPREVEIELTTEDPRAGRSDILLRPTLPADRRRGPIDPAIVRRLAAELAAWDDSLVVLGGFGDPLLHPQFAQILGDLRRAGVYGVAVRTTGLALDDAAIAALMEHRVDLVTVLLDAWSPSLYRRLHGGELQPLVDAIERLEKTRLEQRRPQPLVCPEMIKSVHTLDEIEPFFDGWIRRTGWATIVGHSRYAGALPDLSVMDMSPPMRSSCRRIRDRCTVLADGTLVACDQDFAGARPIGSLADRSLADLWNGPEMTRLRADHDAGRYEADPLCAACAEWHRP